jgi:starch synthase
MPSLFEPCGLGQMIAMRFGSVPVVRRTGGLADTVRDGDTGFAFDAFSADAFWTALQRALLVYNTDSDGWARLRRNGMNEDFSWSGAAQNYAELYERALARVAGSPG